MAGLLHRIVEAIRGGRRSHHADRLESRKNRARRKLKLELLESRQLLAADIQGVVYHDVNDNGLSGGDPRLSGVSVALVRDGGDGIYNNGGGDDTVTATTTSAATTGAYSFSTSTAGTYFVVQTSIPTGGLVQRTSQRVQTVTLTSGDVLGTQIATLDTFNTTQQVVNASFPGSTPAQSALVASESVGGERDIYVDATSGNVSVAANDVSNPGVLVIDVGAGANGTRIVTYDGIDSDAQTVASSGLSNLDLTSSGTANAFRFLIGGETGTLLTIRVGNGANSSTRTVTIPVTVGAAATETLDVPFADFTVNGGTGANFASVGFIQLEITGPNAADAIIDTLATSGPTVVTRNFANLTPMSIGDQVFADRNNNGLFDTGATPPEVGVAGVLMQLFSDTNSNGVYNPGTDTAALDSSGVAITTTTDSTGVYNFTSLLPGAYFVVIPSSQFIGSAAAVGHVVSSTVPVGPTNNSNTGTAIGGGGVVSKLVTLVSGSAPINDGDTNPNSDNSVDIGLFSQYDVTVAKTTTATAAAAGSTITYTVTARNDGPGPATGVVITDDIPDGIQVLSATSSTVGDTIVIPATAQDTTGTNPDNLTVTIGTLAASATTQRTITIVAKVLPDTVGTGSPASITNTATISGLGTETDTLTNTGISTLPVTRNAVLAVTKVGAPTAVQLGSNITYTITMQNQGPATARNVVISDTLPSGLDLVSVVSNVGTATPTQGIGTNPDSFIVNVTNVNVDSPSADTDVVVTVIAQVLSGFVGTTITNTVSADSDDSAPVTNNASNSVQRVIDLAVTKAIVTTPASTTTPAVAPPGSTFTYTLVARNDGPDSATTVRVTDNLPDGIRILSATSSDVTDTITIPASAQDTTASNPDDITIDVGNLAVGAGSQTTITIVGVVLNATLGTITNVASITTTDTTVNFENSSTLGNNSASVSATVPRTIDLGVTKTGPATAIAGNTITYTITANNNGPSDAIGVQVTDNIPDGLRILSASVAGTPITIPASASDTTPANPDDLVFSVGNLASGASVGSIQIVAAILAGTAAGSLINSAVVSTTDTSTVESPSTNNSFSVTSTVSSQNDVAITKSAASTVSAGTELTYTLNVTNSGPSTATNVQVSDALPTGLTFVSGTSLIGSTTAGTVSATSGTASVTIPTLNPGETAVVTIRTSVGASVLGNISNTATVTAANDSNNANNSSAAITTNVTPPPLVSFAGKVYIDSNRNSTNDTGDGSIAGVTVTLTGTPLNTASPVTQTTTTDASGNYLFNNVSQGNYTVRAGSPTDFVFKATNPGTTAGTAGNQEISNITVNANSTSNNVGFTRVFSKRLFLASSPRP